MKPSMELPAGQQVRIRVDGLASPLRALAREISSECITLEAELPWLRLDSAVSTELGPHDVRNGRVRWMGVDVGPSGTARLRISVDVSGRGMLAETPTEAAFFAGTVMPAAAVPDLTSDAILEDADYASYEIGRPRRGGAIAAGVLAFVTLGVGAYLGLRRPHLVQRWLSTPLRVERAEPAPPPPSDPSPHRIIPPAPSSRGS
jgi:hypothetical protein